MTSSETTGGYQCIWSNLNEHPKCPHGPMLLFGRYIDGEYKKFYACSACRDRKLCKFYMDYGSKPTKQQKQSLELETKKVLPRYDHQKMFIRLNEMLAENPAKRMYCHDCGRLSFISEKQKHRGHDVAEGLTDHQMSHPTEILKPLDNPKKEAQYLFSQQSTKNIVDMLLALGAENILCIGAPRIHEYVINNLEDKISSLLLDFDGRFHNFFGPLNFCWYNLFNNHFFHNDSNSIFKDFLTQNGGKNTYIICDPPFGGRVEPISQTLKGITDLHKKLNKIEAEEDNLKTLFIFPYFMEPTLREKSNPAGIQGGLKELKMSDYKVDYDNHPLFARSQDRKIGSPVRIFTDIDLSLLKLPESEGYKYCKRCKKWTSQENKHCKKCKDCTSKDGRRYRHCNACARCVKPTWKHCKKCNRCTLEIHKCGEAPKITGQCFKCNEFGHVEKACTKYSENIVSKSEGGGKVLKVKKRKNEDKDEVSSIKKARFEGNSKTFTIKKKGKLVKAKLEARNKNEAESKASVRLNSKSKNPKLETKIVIGFPKEENSVDNKEIKVIRTRNGDGILKIKKQRISKLKSTDSIQNSKMKNKINSKSIAEKKSLAINLDAEVTAVKRKKDKRKVLNVRKNVNSVNGKVAIKQT